MFDDSGYSSPLSDQEDCGDQKRLKLTNTEFRSSRRSQTCSSCRQNLTDLKIFKGPPPGAIEEELALTDERLQLYNDGESMPDEDTLPQNKITQFDVFDKEGHLCPFDEGLIENDELIYFSGYVKPVYDDDPSAENGIPVQELGPIVQWSISGYDGGNRFLIIFLTPYGEYILMEPSEGYKEFMRGPRQKALLAKLVIEFLGNSDEPVYEELLNRLQEVTVPDGIEPFDDGSLSQHAQFIVDQVAEIDDDGDLLATPAMQTIIDLNGVIVKKCKKKKGTGNVKLSEATMTPFVSRIFEGFFNNEVYFSYKKTGKDDVKMPMTPICNKLSSVVWEEGDESAVVNGETVSVGDFVYLAKKSSVFRVERFFYGNYTKQVHCREFCRGADTILEEASHPYELFMLDECGDWPICKIIEKVDVVIGAQEQIDRFFVRKLYKPMFGCFEDLPEDVDGCAVCTRKAEELTRNTPVFYGNCVKYRDEIYNPGDCVMVEPYAITFDAQKSDTQIQKTTMTVKADEVIYPEIYRKAKEVTVDEECPEPFKIAYVKRIITKTVAGERKIYLIVNKFYRPENTSLLGKNDEKYYDLQLLFWSDEEAEVEFTNVKGKCNVVFSKTPPPEFNSSLGFYYYESYDYSDKSFTNAREVPLPRETKESTVRKLRTLNPFSGCGGLAEGLTQSGVADVKWGIDIDEPTSKSFQMNFPGANVFHTDCNSFLKDLMDGNGKDSYPKPGDVEMLIGGPPCQGFSTMNLFTARQYSRFKNSLIVTYLSFCDYYRPKYFVLENVKNFICFKKSVLLKHVLACLVAMGYQVTFAILQGGNYGLPQTRRRLFVIAAAPGNPLPKFPNPTHVFHGQLCVYEYEIVGKKFSPNFFHPVHHSAPYRTVTIRDALRDLPKISEKSCQSPPTSYKRFLKSDESQPIKDHIAKEVSPLNEARIKYIPAAKNCDWRDLPNIPVKLRDGTVTNLLKYTHHDRKNGKSKCGLFRGVCACASGKKCDPAWKQHNTLIPWCLPHTANRNNNWSGLYGRLDWDGFFNTTITNPEPSCKQGRVLHPEEDRVVSVRECARSQGLPDYFRLCGSIMEKYRQVGNAVPSPVARAIGYEIKKCLKDA